MHVKRSKTAVTYIEEEQNYLKPQLVFLSTRLFFRLKQYLFLNQTTCAPSSSVTA